MSRFDPVYWTVNFPRPMMASVVTTAPDALRVDAAFYRRDDLAGLIWEAEDRHDHPLLRYETARDFRRCKLSFRWRSAGVLALDVVNGPTLTIEGRDAAGASRAWYVRLWNYAVGSPGDATVTLDFGDLRGGFALPADADPVWAGDIDRMFISLAPPGYGPADAPLPVPREGWVEMSAIRCEGSGSVLAVGDVVVPEYRLRIASGYDDSYHLTPERLLRNMLRLGYRGMLVHYVGMSHYFRLERSGPAMLATATGGALNVACAAWHRDFLARAGALGFSPVLSLSYELLDQHCRVDWKQRAADGTVAQTGWDPPSALLSPAQPAAMAYLREVAAAFARLAVAAGVRVRFQVGEPWWWVTQGGKLCVYDAAAKAALPVHAAINDVRAPMTAGQKGALDAAGAMLAASTAALVAAVRAVAADAEALVLVYLPTVMDEASPELRRANVPVGWAAPAFDVLQCEDYDWAAAGRHGATMRGVAAMAERLGYPAGDQHYFSGFVLRPEDRAQWAAIAEAARRSEAAETVVWALPQVIRDGFTWFEGEEEAVCDFDDVRFPIAIGREAEVAPGFSTAIVTSAGGGERRNVEWSAARTRYDVGPGVRSEADIATLLAFFRARMGAARGFRLQDPFDWRSGAAGVSALDQSLGVGDGVRTAFPLVKRYGESARRITRPVAGTVRVSVGGSETGAFTLEAMGVVELDQPPAAGVEVRAGFAFDVPVRFAEDVLRVNRATFLAGEAASVPLVEVREG